MTPNLNLTLPSRMLYERLQPIRHVPIDSDEDAWLRRLLVVTFKAAAHEQHWGNLVDVLIRNETPGILNWLLEGRKKLAKDKYQFKRTEEQQRSTAALVTASQSPKSFVRECLKREEGAEMDSVELYAHYQQWCVNNGMTPLAGRFFSQMVKDEIETTLGLRMRHDLKSSDGTSIRGWKHLGIIKSEFATT